MQIEGTTSSSASTSGIHFGSDSRSMSSVSESRTESQLKFIYRDVVKLDKALDSIKDYFRLRSDGDKNLVMSKTKAGKIADLFKDVADALNSLFDNRKIPSSTGSDLGEFISEMRSNVKSAVSDAFDSTSLSLKTDYGIMFDFSSSARRVIDFTSLDQSELIRELTADGGAVNELFYGKRNRDNDGLLEKMSEALKSVQTDLQDILGTSGVFVDTRA